MKLGVVSTWDSPFIWSKYALNLAEMVSDFRRKRPEWGIDAYFGSGVDPAARHIDCVIQAIDDGCDLICFTGADQIHPVDMLDRLVTRYEETGGGVITAMVPFRGYVQWQEMRPFQPLAWRIRNDAPTVRECRGYQADPDMFEVIDQESEPVLDRVDVIGSGVLLFDRDCALGMKPPWFYDKRDILTMQRVADTDTRFVWRLRAEVQARVYVDKSIMVKHLHPFEIDNSFQYRFDDMMERGKGQDDVFRYRERAK